MTYLLMFDDYSESKSVSVFVEATAFEYAIEKAVRIEGLTGYTLRGVTRLSVRHTKGIKVEH